MFTVALAYASCLSIYSFFALFGNDRHPAWIISLLGWLHVVILLLKVIEV